MPFPGFDNLSRLSNPLATKPYRAKLLTDSDAAFELARAEIRLRDVVRATWAEGSALPGDIVWTTLIAPLVVHERVLELFSRQQFTGWVSSPVELHFKAGGVSSEYHLLGITGRCGQLDLGRSELKLRELPGGWIPYFRGHYFVPDTWDGSDLFMHERDNASGRGWAHRFVTEPVVRALAKAKIRNVRFERLPEVEVMTSTYTIGSPHLLSSDYEQRLQAAYAAAGVPRPDFI